MRFPVRSFFAVSVVSILMLLNVGAARAQFATQVVAYDATGANPNYTNPVNALGPPSTVSTPSTPDNSGIVTIGSGGYLVLAFDSPLKPDATRMNGYDFIVFGNAFYVGGNSHVRYQKPAIVEVGVDSSGNGYDASDPFYVLQGSPNPLSGYPFKGIDDRQFTTWGYANVTPTNGAGDPQIPTDPFASGIGAGSAGGDALKLSWAVDGSGKRVTLDHVDFIRIRTAGNWPCAIDAVAIVRSAGRSVSGTLTLDGEATAALPAVQVEIRNPGATTPAQTFDLTTGGSFTLAPIPPGKYDLAFKGSNTLRRVIHGVDLTASDVTNLAVTLLAGDANGDNSCDSSDFTALIGSYNSDRSIIGSGYDPAADFNNDGSVDSSDFTLLIGSFGQTGDE